MQSFLGVVHLECIVILLRQFNHSSDCFLSDMSATVLDLHDALLLNACPTGTFSRTGEVIRGDAVPSL